MFAWVTQLEPFVRQYGLAGLFLDVFLESLGLPLPGETLIIVASGLAALGQLNIYLVATTAFAAAVIGDNTGYLIGRKFGRPVIVKHGSRIGISHERLAYAERVIEKRGPIVVALARFFIILRQLNGIAAGTAGMHWLHFLIANAIGAALWVGLWTTLAYQFGKNVSILPYIWNHLSTVALFVIRAFVLVLVCIWLWH